MQTITTIREGGKDGGLSINLTSSDFGFLELEIANSTTSDNIAITIFTDNKAGFLDLLRRVTDECLLRVRNEEQTGERDDA